MPHSALLELAETLAEGKSEKKSAQSDAPAPPRITLPRIHLPNFSGKYED